MRLRTRPGTRPPRRPMKRTRTPSSWSSSRRRSSRLSLKLMMKRTSSSGPPPVLGREGVDGHPLEADVEPAVDGVEQGLLARGVALGALQPPPLRPPAVAVHDRARRGGAPPSGRPRRSASWARGGTYLASRYDPPPWPCGQHPRRGGAGYPGAERGSRVKDSGRAWTAVVNPAAGKGRTRKLLPRLTEALTGALGDVEVHVTTDAGDVLRRSPRRLRGGPDGGGLRRGRHRERARAASPSETGGVLGIVPTGSGNDFAAHLGLDWKRWRDAVGVLDAGPRRPRRSRPGRARRRHDGVVHVRRQLRLRLRGQPVGQRGALGHRHDALRARGGADPRRVLARAATGSPSTARRATSRRGWWPSGTPAATPAGCASRPTPASTTASSTCAWSDAVSRAGFLRAFPRVFKGTHTSHPAVVDVPGEGHRAGVARAGRHERALRQRRAHRPAAGAHGGGAGRAAGAGAGGLAGAGRATTRPLT